MFILKKIYQNKSFRSFSLIELLVVMAVMSLLAALIQPALQKTKSKAYFILCGSNLKTIHMAMDQYVGDYLIYPYSISNVNGSSAGGITWDDALATGYDQRTINSGLNSWNIQPKSAFGSAEANAIYHCPQDESNRNVDDAYPRTYGINTYKYWAKSGIANYWREAQDKRWSASINEIPAPSQTFLLMESQRGYMGHPFYAGVTSALGFTDPTHSLGFNFLFVDGHQENLLLEETWDSTKSVWQSGGYWSRDPDD